tara:strand:- start:19688 stop:22231 length:2544 start_codon:yes stop_codon:yes gene_type:complete
MKDRITIAELDIDTDALIRKATETRSSIDLLKRSQKLLADQGKKNSEAFTENEVAIKKLSTEYNQQKKVLTQLTNENGKVVSSEEAFTNSVNKNVKSIESARASNKELLAIRNKLDLSTDKGRKQLDQLNSKLDENNKFIKDNVSAYEQQKIGIGDYEGAIRKVFPAGGQLVGVLGQIKGGLIAQKTALQGATAGTTGLSKASKLLRIALISTGIGAIVVALGTLIAAFQSTQAGSDAVSRALAPIKGAFQGIIGVIQDISLNIFSQLGDRFTIVSGKILNGIDLIRIGWNKISGDTEEVDMLQARLVERTKEIAEAQTSLNEKTNKLGEIWDGAGKRISEASEAQTKIADLQIQIEKAEIRLVTQRARSMRIIKEQNKIGEDTTKTLEERTTAIQKANAESDKLLKAEQNIIDLKIRQTKIQQSQNDTSREGEMELAQLQAERENKKTQSLELQTTLQNKLNTVQKQAEAESLQEDQRKVDLAISTAEKELEVFKNNHQQKLDENKFFSAEIERQELERIQKIKDEQLRVNKKLLEDGLITQQEFNTRQKEADQQFNDEKQEIEAKRKEAQKEQEAVDLENQRAIRQENFMSEYAVKLENLRLEQEAEIKKAVKTGANIELIKKKFALREAKLEQDKGEAIQEINAQTFSAIGDLLGQSTAVGKAIAIYQAGINVQEGITKALAQGGILGIATGAIVGAKGYQAIRKIASTNKPDTKFEKGGLQEIGGNRHSSGGTKFYGEDGTRFEAERGELIGVMSRPASKKFMEFNNRFTPQSTLSSSMNLGNYENGGLISPIMGQVSKPDLDANNFARVVANEINKVKVVTVVDDVTSMQGLQSEIINGSNV